MSSQLNPLSTNFTKWSNTLKQFIGKLPTNCLRVSDHVVELAFKGVSNYVGYNLVKMGQCNTLF